jgi:hypothetical protein
MWVSMWPDLLIGRNAIYVRGVRAFRVHSHCPFRIEQTEARRAIGLRQLSGIYTQKYRRRHHETGFISCHGYTLKEIADYFRIYYTSISQGIMKKTISNK